MVGVVQNIRVLPRYSLTVRYENTARKLHLLCGHQRISAPSAETSIRISAKSSESKAYGLAAPIKGSHAESPLVSICGAEENMDVRENARKAGGWSRVHKEEELNQRQKCEMGKSRLQYLPHARLIPRSVHEVLRDTLLDSPFHSSFDSALLKHKHQRKHQEIQMGHKRAT